MKQVEQFSVLPGDKPFGDNCSRCGKPLGGPIVIAEWNNKAFGYCPECVDGATGVAA